jgi:hypothetical protein
LLALALLLLLRPLFVTKDCRRQHSQLACHARHERIELERPRPERRRQNKTADAAAGMDRTSGVAANGLRRAFLALLAVVVFGASVAEPASQEDSKQLAHEQEQVANETEKPNPCGHSKENRV